MPDAYEQMREEIEKRLARKKHAALLRIFIQILKEENEESVKNEIKARLAAIKED